MNDRSQPQLLALTVIVFASLLLAACTGTGEPALQTSPPAEQQATEEEHEEGEVQIEEEHEEGEGDAGDDEHMHEHSPDDHMEGAHDVPEEASELVNPVEPTDDSVETGRSLYAENCAVCHGETGEGDGPSAGALDPAPADLHADHVQALTDGGLFYMISHGSPDTAMPAWEGTLTEEERWHIVNFLRTFQED